MVAPRSAGGNAAIMTANNARGQQGTERAMQRAAGDQQLAICYLSGKIGDASSRGHVGRG